MIQNETLSAIQKRMIRALIESRNITVACKRVGVGRATVYRWLQEPLFKAELEKAESALVEVVGRSLIAGSETMLEILYQIAVEGDETSIRRNACKDWLELALRYRDYANISKRLDELEEVYEELSELSKETK